MTHAKHVARPDARRFASIREAGGVSALHGKIGGYSMQDEGFGECAHEHSLNVRLGELEPRRERCISVKRRP